MDVTNPKYEMVRPHIAVHDPLFARHADHVALSQIRDIGSGNFGVAKLMRDKQTGELVAVKFIERGEKVGSLASLLLQIEECRQLTLACLYFTAQPGASFRVLSCLCIDAVLLSRVFQRQGCCCLTKVQGAAQTRTTSVHRLPP